MRIAHYAISSDLAGGQVVALELARGALDAGHEVMVLVHEDGPFVARAEAQAIRALTFPRSGALDVRAAVRMARVLRAERVEIVHTHALFSGNTVSRLAANLAGVPVVSHAHVADLWRTGTAAASAQRQIDRLTARLCACVIAVSEELRGRLLEQRYPPRRVVVIPNGIARPRKVDATEVADARVGLGIPLGVPLVTSIARLCAVKGQRELIGALSSLGVETYLLLVGEDLEAGGAYLELLQAEATRLGVADRVVFAGRREDVPALLAASDVFALPSTMEGMPISVIEAMAAARPVVATAVGGVPELVVDGETGLLIDDREPGRLAAALGLLLGDPARAEAMGAAAHMRFERDFTSARMVERVLAVYDAIPR